MKKYHVYCVSNALVDLEFEVSPDFLKKHATFPLLNNLLSDLGKKRWNRVK